MDKSTEMAEAVWQAAEPIFLDTVMPVAAQLFEQAFEPGGQGYEQIMNGAILGAKLWYGMYRPKFYKRGYTLSDRGNIAISHGPAEIEGTDLSISCFVQNLSPHLDYTYGFMMVNGEYRRGGDVMAMVPDNVDVNIDLPANVVSEAARDAILAVM